MWALSAVDWLHIVSGISKGTALLSSISYSYKPSETHWLRPFNKFLQLALCRKGQKLCYTWKGSVGFSQAIFVVLKDCQAVTAVRQLSRVLMQCVCVCASCRILLHRMTPRIFGMRSNDLRWTCPGYFLSNFSTWPDKSWHGMALALNSSGIVLGVQLQAPNLPAGLADLTVT